MTKTITATMQQIGDKHIILLSAAEGLEPIREEYDSEDDAQAAMQRVVDSACEMKRNGLAITIRISGEVIPVGVA